MQNNMLKIYIIIESILENKWTQRALFFIMGLFIFEPCFAGVEGDMKASVEGLQKEIFGSGWATVGKIGAGATGIVMSIAKMNMVPVILGGLSSGGIHFFQKYTEAAAGCLI